MILKNKNKVMKVIKESASLKATRLTKIRDGPISDMEKLLTAWIEEQTQKRIPVTIMVIGSKQKTFKAYYLRRTLAEAIATTEEDTEKILIQFWKDCDICDCIMGLPWARGDVTKDCMNGTQEVYL
ncbi:hypothetical protein mRhiFer1_010308 [Rhinolophus ferrumequinum]|uniref:Uncharacterized protein n=1 Tax=Rhinolophus ferrumequinum TaxID=59479 RepID=A0A7J7X5K9_RHIFE|nr:hypothetical protein mRhiFer1_010308 [Rhinolophus ferrumequinum]